MAVAAPVEPMSQPKAHVHTSRMTMTVKTTTRR